MCGLKAVRSLDCLLEDVQRSFPAEEAVEALEKMRKYGPGQTLSLVHQPWRGAGCNNFN